MSTGTITLDDAPLNKFHLRVTVFTTGGMFVDGYILGIVGIALSVWSKQIEISALWDGLIGASALAGICIGSLFFGPIADRVGRQKLFTIDLMLFVVCSALQFFVGNPAELFVIRFIMGLAIGIDYAIGAALLAEFLPRKQRGPLLACLNAVWTLGYVAAYVVGYSLQSTGGESWRWMLASSTVPALAVLALRIGCPESPRWLAGKGRIAEADAVIKKFIGQNVVLGERPQPAAHAPLRELFSRRWRARTAFASVFWFCQVLPFFALFTFAPQVLSALGLKSEYTGGLVLNLFQLFGGVVGVVCMNMLSRRTFVIVSFAIMAAAIAMAGYSPHPSTAIVTIAFIIFAFVVSAAGNLETVYPSELFPTHLRASGVGFAAAMSRVGAAIGTFLLPMSLAAIGTQLTMLLAAAVLVVGLIASIAWSRDTRSLTLADASNPQDDSAHHSGKLGSKKIRPAG